MARTRPSKRPANIQEELKTLLLQKRAELVAKLRDEREGRIEATSRREKIEGTPFGDRPALSPDDEMGFAVADRRAGMLAQVDLALKKMDEGTYGRCEACEEEIAPRAFGPIRSPCAARAARRSGSGTSRAPRRGASVVGPSPRRRPERPIASAGRRGPTRVAARLRKRPPS